MNTVEKKWYKKWWGILSIILACLVFIIIVAFGLKIWSISKSLNNSEINYASLATNKLSENELRIIEGTKNNYWTGTNEPKITIVEFSDYACPYCKTSYSKIREISVKYKDTVKFIFRDYPINSEQSLLLANAGRCAGEQGLFWLAHDKLFQNQGLKENSEIKALMKSIGVDMIRFNKCYDEQKYLNDIKKDLSDGDILGITGTPTWFINGNIIKGDIPYDIFINIIEELNKIL